MNWAAHKLAIPGSRQGHGMAERGMGMPLQLSTTSLSDCSLDLTSTESLGWAVCVLCVCMDAFGGRTCVPSSKFCLNSDSDLDGHYPSACPLMAGQNTMVTRGCSAQMGRAEPPHVLRAWAGPQQNMGVKIKLGEGQHKVGGTH